MHNIVHNVDNTASEDAEKNKEKDIKDTIFTDDNGNILSTLDGKDY